MADQSLLHSTESGTYRLRWKNHKSNLVEMLDFLIKGGSYVDCTIVVDDHIQFKAHRVVLAANSPYFRSILQSVPMDRCCINFPGVKASEMGALLEYMYTGEVKVTHTQMRKIIRLATDLKVKGLFETINMKEKFNNLDEEHSERATSGAYSSSTLPTIMCNATAYASPLHFTAAVPQNGDSLIPTATHISPTASNRSSVITRGLILSPTSGMVLNPDKSLMSHIHRVTAAKETEKSLAEKMVLDGNLFNQTLNTSEYSNDKKHSDADRKSDYEGNFQLKDLSSNLNQKPESRRYKKYSRADMMSAIQFVRAGTTPIEAARMFGVPSRTLYDNVKKLGITKRRSMNLTMIHSPSSVGPITDLPSPHDYRHQDLAMDQQIQLSNINSGIDV